jgi:hypothetical protein
MSDANQLQRAYEFIEVDKLDEARAILEPIIAAENDNADAWWLYAHSVYEPEAARGALQNVLRIDPDYPEASSLLIMLDQQVALQPQQSGVTLTQPPLKTLKSLGTSESPIVTPTSSEMEDVPDFSSDDDEIDFDDTLPDDEEESKPGFRLPMPILAILVVVGIIILGLIFVALFLPPSNLPEATSDVAGLTTDEPTVAVEFSTLTPIPDASLEPVETETTGDNQTEPTQEGETDEDVTPEEPTAEEGASSDIPTAEGGSSGEPTQEETTDEDTATPTEDTAPIGPDESGGGEVMSPEEAEELLLEALGDFTLAEDPIETMDTELGSTYVVSVCSTPEELRTTAIGTMEVIAENGENITDVDAFAVRINDCDDETTTLRLLGVSREDALDYASGALSDDEFQSSWTPLG